MGLTDNDNEKIWQKYLRATAQGSDGYGGQNLDKNPLRIRGSHIPNDKDYGDCFNKFPIGMDDPGVRHFHDEGEENYLDRDPGTKKDVTYYFNSWHYRGELEPGENRDAAFGCSFTFGQASNTPWPEVLGIVNCGQPGSSNDKIARLAITYCKTFKPKEIYVMWTFAQRREWVNELGFYTNYKGEIKENNYITSHLFELTNDKWDEYNYEKNKLLLQSFCSANNIKLNETTVTEVSRTEYPPGRDKMHPGPDWHVVVAEKFNTQ